MTSMHRLVGGPRDGEKVENVPSDYTVVNHETFDVPSAEHDDIVVESDRFVARWRGDELIYLTIGPEYDDGELLRRADAPNDAFRASFDMRGEDVGGTAGEQYEVWAVER